MQEREPHQDTREEDSGSAWQAAIEDTLQIQEEIKKIRIQHPGEEGEQIINGMKLEAELAEAIKEEAARKREYDDTLDEILKSSDNS